MIMGYRLGKCACQEDMESRKEAEKSWEEHGDVGMIFENLKSTARTGASDD